MLKIFSDRKQPYPLSTRKYHRHMPYGSWDNVYTRKQDAGHRTPDTGPWTLDRKVTTKSHPEISFQARQKGSGRRGLNTQFLKGQFKIHSGQTHQNSDFKLVGIRLIFVTYSKPYLQVRLHSWEKRETVSFSIYCRARQ